MRHARSLVVARGIQFSDQRSNPDPGIRNKELALGPPEKSVSLSFFTYFLFSFSDINKHVQCARHRNTMPNKTGSFASEAY